MKTFREYIKEMIGTSAVYDGTPDGPDFQWAGDPKSMNPQDKKKKKKHESKRKDSQS